jgi:hypothetical protein
MKKSHIFALLIIIVLPAVLKAQTPTISGVTVAPNTQNWAITITGSGFGTLAPYTGTSAYIEVHDTTENPNWDAGLSPGKNYGGNTEVSLIITSWTDTEIVIGGFAGVYDDGNNGWYWQLSPGDDFVVTVTNPTSGLTGSFAPVQVPSFPPTITLQPASVSVPTGGSTTFSVAATAAAGTSGLTYQWSLNGTAISGATSPSYSIASATASNAGSYSVKVSNLAGSSPGPAGSVVSNSAVLTVDTSPSITTAPVSATWVAGQSTSLSVVAAGIPSPTYQWSLNGTPIVGATSATYSVNSVTSASAGSYTVSVMNSQGTVVTSPATVTVTSGSPTFNGITFSPDSQNWQVTVNGSGFGTLAPYNGDSAYILVVDGTTGAHYGLNPDSTQFFGYDGSGLYVTSWTDTQIQIGGFTSSPPSGGDSIQVFITNPQSHNQVGANPFAITGVGPTITSQPSSVSLVVGGSTSFVVSATPSPGTSPTTALSYQWKLNGNSIGGATSSTYLIPSVSSGSAGTYTVVVSDYAGSVVSSGATLVAETLPAITTQPATTVGVAGNNVTFSVVATGVPAPTYQWLFNGTPIAGATAASYTVVDVTQANAGSYTAVASNLVGNTDSNAAALSVATLPVITLQPISQSVAVGTTVTMSVSATGSPQPTYQWSFDSLPIYGATGSSYVIPNSSTGETGTYSVTVTNLAGSVSSQNVSLAVVALPVISLQPASPSAAIVGGTMSLGVTATGGSTYQWYLNGVPISTTLYSSADAPTLTIPTLSSANSGQYTVVVTNSAGSVTSSPTQVNVSTSDTHPINISTRALVESGSNVLIAGFVVSGPTSERLLVRGVGPTLAEFDVSGVLSSPSLTVFDSQGAVIGTNTGWGNPPATGTSNVAATVAPATAAIMTSVGAFALPADSADSAMVITVPPGNYTAEISGASGNAGVALVEVYDIP